LALSFVAILIDHWIDKEDDFKSKEDRKLTGPGGLQDEIHEWFEEANPATKAE